jgi:hypothetical protein
MAAEISALLAIRDCSIFVVLIRSAGAGPLPDPELFLVVNFFSLENFHS